MRKRIYFLLINLILFYAVCGFSEEKEIESFNIPYKAEGEFKDTYVNLVESNIRNKNIKKIINYAKKIAIKSGYKIIGSKFTKVIIDNKECSLDVIVYENAGYYHVLFDSASDCIQEDGEGGYHWSTSNELRIVIQKETNKIISILMGS